LWIAQTEGAKFWLKAVTELKNRGVTDIFIACVDGRQGFCVNGRLLFLVAAFSS
jgi:putative transposase